MLNFIVFIPLITSLISGLTYKNKSTKLTQILTISGVFLSLALVIKLMFMSEISLHYSELASWMKIGSYELKWKLMADRLTIIMLFTVTLVSLCVHIYSTAYMADDQTINRFMSYLSLFTFFMLMLVTSSNLLMLFFSWEGVGMCSYLLVGYWHQKPTANNAAMKAFVVNRVADVAFILGIIMIYHKFGSLEFSEIFAKLKEIDLQQVMFENFGLREIDVLCLLLLLGAMGKSAQIGFHVWLPDAMEGPTPVSALIHAATMVTAGVFLIARCSFIFEKSVIICQLMLIIGAITCIFGGMVAIAQNDIKKIIAYSTCSQLGYMFMACGARAYNIAIFHLVTHAFFKALLFLGAGSVIYAMHHEQDIRKMGGLIKKIPITYTIFLVGSLAIMGVYPLSGYYSKDAILEFLFESISSPELNIFAKIAYILGITSIFFTSLYSLKILLKVFHGKFSHDSHVNQNHDHEIEVKEPPKTMLMPLYILAIGSIISGYVLTQYFSIKNPSFWLNSLSMNYINSQEEEIVPYLVKSMPFIITATGVILSVIDHFFGYKISNKLSCIFKIFTKLLNNKFYFDEIYCFLLVKTYRYLCFISANIFDVIIIDRFFVNNWGRYFSFFSRRISVIQSGYIYNYAVIIIFFTVSIISYVIFYWGVGK